MNIVDFLSLFLIIFVFVITPGPGTLAVFAKRLSQGFLPAFYLSLGLVLGDLLYLGAVIFSLDLFAQMILPLMQYVRILGGAYLVYLGVSTWRAQTIAPESHTRRQSGIKAFLAGLFISLTNPKVMIFYIALLPAFIDLSSVGLVYAIQIISTVGLGLLLGICLINVTAGHIGQRLVKTNIVNKIVAVIMVAAGLLLGLS